MRRFLLMVASVLVSALFLWLALRDVPLAEVVDGLQQAEIGWVLLGLLLVFGAQASRAVRWWVLLGGRISNIRSLHIMNIMMMLNQVPLRVGEVARTLLAAQAGVPLMTAATSIVVERLIDIVAVIVLLAFAVSQLPDAAPIVTGTLMLLGAGAVIGFIVLIAFARYPQIAARMLTWLETRVTVLARLNLHRRLDEVLEGLRTLTDPRRAALTLLWTVIGWAFSLMTFAALLRALDLTNVNPWITGAITVPLVALSIAIPVSVASLGPFQGAVRAGGAAVGMSAIGATTLGFLFHGVTVIAYIIYGVIGLIALGVSLGQVVRSPKVSEV